MGTRALWSHEIRLPPEAGSVFRARDFVRFRLASHDVGYLVDDVALVVSELATNALLHAQTPFKVALHAFEQTVLLEVEDGSQSGPFRAAEQVLDTGGSGIFIVNLLSRDWGVDARTDGGKSVWAEFDRR